MAIDKVLVFGMTSVRGGVESFIMNNYRTIDKKELKFDFLTNESHIAYEEEIQSNHDKIYHIHMRSHNPVKYYLDIHSFFKHHSAEYSGIWVNVSSLGNIDYLEYAQKFGIKKRVIHCHNSQNMDGSLRGYLHDLNRNRVKRVATDFWSCSDVASKWFFGPKIMRLSTYKYIPNAVDCSRFAFNRQIRTAVRASLKIPDSSIVLGHVGRFHKQKNHIFLLHIFKEFLSQDQNSQLLLVGTGPEENSVRELSRTLGIEDNIIFLGERNDAERLYQAMDIFIFPSMYEGMSIALLEAQAAGLPCIISEGNPLESQINDNVIRIPLDLGAEKWSSYISSILEQRVDLLNNRVPDSIYDVNSQGSFIQHFFTAVS